MWPPLNKRTRILLFSSPKISPPRKILTIIYGKLYPKYKLTLRTFSSGQRPYLTIFTSMAPCSILTRLNKTKRTVSVYGVDKHGRPSTNQPGRIRTGCDSRNFLRFLGCTLSDRWRGSRSYFQDSRKQRLYLPYRVHGAVTDYSFSIWGSKLP